MSHYASGSGTFIHGIAASEHLDTSGERILMEGLDISSLANVAPFNFEHNSNQPTQIVGKVLEAKKIYKEEDCENDHHRHFWNKIRTPFLYVSGELFDGVGHSGAQEVAAMLRYDKMNKGSNPDERQMVNFSIEGSRLQTDGGIVKKCIARKVSITITPCNKVCEAEEMAKEDPAPSLSDIFNKSESTEVEILKKAETKYLPNLASKKIPKKPESNKATFSPLTPMSPGKTREAKPINPTPTSTSTSLGSKTTWKVGDRVEHKPSQLKSGKKIYSDPSTYEKDEKYESSVRKAIIKKAKEDKKNSVKTNAYRKMSQEALDNFEKKEELIDFIRNSMENLDENEVIALAKTFAYVKSKQKK